MQAAGLKAVEGALLASRCLCCRWASHTTAGACHSGGRCARACRGLSLLSGRLLKGCLGNQVGRHKVAGQEAS